MTARPVAKRSSPRAVPSMTMPEPYVSSACATVPSSFSVMWWRSRPNAFTRKSIAAFASWYRRVGMIMARKLRGHRGDVLDGCDQVLGRRPAGELLEVAVEVRLVVVAAVERRIDQAGARAEPLDGALEAQQPRERLGRQPELPAERRREVAPAPAQLVGERADRNRPVGLVQSPPRPLERGRDRRRLQRPRGDRALEQREPGGPVRCGRQPLGELVRAGV